MLKKQSEGWFCVIHFWNEWKKQNKHYHSVNKQKNGQRKDKKNPGQCKGFFFGLLMLNILVSPLNLSGKKS